jgi:hypothetical protein
MFVQVPCLRTRPCHASRCLVPPSPELLTQLYARYQELMRSKRLPGSTTFEQFYFFWRASRRGENFVGLDDGATASARSDAPQLIDRPSLPLRGVIQTLVLLVDFNDRPHGDDHTPAMYEQMLFGEEGIFLTGSMREYYRQISHFNPDDGPNNQGIDVQGRVHGWFRLPETSEFYTNNSSGMGTYPRNVQRMAEDAVNVALAQGVDFSPDYDVLREGMVTALFLIHAGSGAVRRGSRGTSGRDLGQLGRAAAWASGAGRAWSARPVSGSRGPHTGARWCLRGSSDRSACWALWWRAGGRVAAAFRGGAGARAPRLAPAVLAQCVDGGCQACSPTPRADSSHSRRGWHTGRRVRGVSPPAGRTRATGAQRAAWPLPACRWLLTLGHSILASDTPSSHPL